MTAFDTSLRIIRRSIKSILGEPLGVMRDMWLPILLVGIASGLLAYIEIKRVLFPSDAQIFQVLSADDGTQQIGVGNGELVLAVFPFVSIILGAVGIVALAILWHRKEIIQDRKLGGARTVFAYVLYALPIGLIAALSLVLPSILLGFVAEFWSILGWTLALYLTFRFSPVLPAAAIGHRIGYSSAWNVTGSLALVCFFLVLFRLALTLAASAIDAALFQQGIPWSIIILGAMLTAIFEVLVSIALVTQLYLVAFTPKN